MAKKEKKRFYFFLVAIIAGMAFYFLYASKTNAPVDYIQSASSTTNKTTGNSSTSTISSVNFSKEGNLVRRNNSWYLIYEEPGKPALSLIIKFDFLSVCLISGQRVNCGNISNELQGIRVGVRGEKTDKSILVKNLSTIDNR